MDQQLTEYVEEVGLWADRMGMPRSVGRVLGYLLVCDPPEASSQDVADALQASAGSVSSALRLLTNSGLAERVAVSGDRRLYVRVTPDTIDGIMEGEVARIAALRDLAERGVAVLDAADVGERRAERVTHLRDLAVFFEQAWPSLLERWGQQDPSGTRDAASPDQDGAGR